MKTVVTILFYLTIICINAQGQTKANKNTGEVCDLPNVVLGAFDTSNCKKQVDTVDQMKSILEMGNMGDKFIEQFSNGKFQYYYQRDTDRYSSPVLYFYFKSLTIFIFFQRNNLIGRVSYYDSCKLTEIIFDEKGQIREKYFCDYSKPDNCYSKSYSHGILQLETDLEPFNYSGIKDLDTLNGYCQDRKAIPVKEIRFNEKGEKISEQKLDPKSYYRKW